MDDDILRSAGEALYGIAAGILPLLQKGAPLIR